MLVSRTRLAVAQRGPISAILARHFSPKSSFGDDSRSSDNSSRFSGSSRFSRGSADSAERFSGQNRQRGRFGGPYGGRGGMRQGRFSQPLGDFDDRHEPRLHSEHTHTKDPVEEEDPEDPFEGLERRNSGIDFDKYDSIPVEFESFDGDHLKHPDSFAEMDIHQHVRRKAAELGYTKPTPCQRHAVPIICSGRDLMVASQTGSGKTAAFLMPAVSSLLRDDHYFSPRQARWGPIAQPRVLVLAPTRELASQITSEAKLLLRGSRLSACAVYGGTKMESQARDLRQVASHRNSTGSVDVLVATPGRLEDMLERGMVSLAQVRFLVLDEADRMLDMGFEPQIRKIVEGSDMPAAKLANPAAAVDGDEQDAAAALQERRQTMMFSATFPRSIRTLAADFMHNFTFMSIGRVGAATELVEQRFVQCPGHFDAKIELVKSLIEGVEGTTLIFTETKRAADRVADVLSSQGVRSDSIHGDRSQNQRARIMRSFAQGRLRVMVATNVAARGIDVDVGHVINWELPESIDDYVHRIGRTGRAGNHGVATSFVDSDCDYAKDLVSSAAESKSSEVPDWLQSLASAQSRNFGRSSRGRGGSFGRGRSPTRGRFGGRPSGRGEFSRGRGEFSRGRDGRDLRFSFRENSSERPFDDSRFERRPLGRSLSRFGGGDIPAVNF